MIAVSWEARVKTASGSDQAKQPTSTKEESQMTPTVKLSEIVEALDGAPEEQAYYMDKRTGEIILVTDEDKQAAEVDDPTFQYPDWQRESILRAREVLQEPDHFLQLPDKFEVHEYQIMEDFCLEFEDRDKGKELHRLIKGDGAFRRFKNAIREMSVDDAWYKFKQGALEKIAIEWLEENGISYSRDEAPDASEASM